MRKLMIVLGLFALSVPAAAQPAAISIQVTEADVQNDASLANLYERIEDAAAKMCLEGRYALSPLTARSSACTRATVAASIERAGVTSLSAYHIAQQAPAGETTTLAAAR
jgi:UrcA family protein